MHEKTPKKETPRRVGAFLYINYWRREPESSRPTRLCRPLHNRFAIAPQADWNLAADSQVCLATERSAYKTKREALLPLRLERETRLELATSTLARLRSTN